MKAALLEAITIVHITENGDKFVFNDARLRGTPVEISKKFVVYTSDQFGQGVWNNDELYLPYKASTCKSPIESTVYWILVVEGDDCDKLRYSYFKNHPIDYVEVQLRNKSYIHS